MIRSRSSSVAVLFALTLAACGGGDTPTQPIQPTPPPVAATPAPAPSPSGAPFVRVTANMFGWYREGVVQRTPLPPVFRPADWIDMDCTPRDADGRATPNHPRQVEWYYTSGGPGVLIDRLDYWVIDDETFNPQIQLRYSCRTGYIDVWCRVGGINSNEVRINVRGN